MLSCQKEELSQLKSALDSQPVTDFFFWRGCLSKMETLGDPFVSICT